MGLNYIITHFLTHKTIIDFQFSLRFTNVLHHAKNIVQQTKHAGTMVIKDTYTGM